MSIFEASEAYKEAVAEAERIANTADVVSLESSDIIRLSDAHRILQLHNAVVSLATVQQQLVGDFMGAVETPDEAAEEEEPEEVMPRAEFSETFVDSFRSLVREHAYEMPNETSPMEYAIEAVGAYYGDPVQRRKGPEWCAEKEFGLLP